MCTENYIKRDLDEQTQILTLTLNRRDNDRNQINSGVIRALTSMLEPELIKSALSGVILISAREKVFSTGADIDGELKDLNTVEAARFSRFGKEVFALFTALSCPTVAALSGFVLGGGLELALCCDFRVATKNVRVGLPEINLGIIPGWGGTQRLPRLIGHARALRMILSGDPVNAATAREYGLVDELVDDHQALLPAAKKLLAKFNNKSRAAVAMAKRAVYDGAEMSLRSALALESELFGLSWSTPAREEGFSAYLERRRPNWSE